MSLKILAFAFRARVPGGLGGLPDRKFGKRLALVIVMLYRPAGLWHSPTRRREFRHATGTDVLKEGE